MDKKRILEVGIFVVVAGILAYALKVHNNIVDPPEEPVVPARFPNSQAPDYLQYNLPPYRNSLVPGFELYFRPPSNGNGVVGQPSVLNPQLPLPTCGCSGGGGSGIDLGDYASSINALMQNFAGSLGEVMDNYVTNILGSMPEFWRQYLNRPESLLLDMEHSRDDLVNF